MEEKVYRLLKCTHIGGIIETNGLQDFKKFLFFFKNSVAELNFPKMTKQHASNNTSSNSSREDLLSLRVAKIINKQETQAGAGA